MPTVTRSSPSSPPFGEAIVWQPVEGSTSQPNKKDLLR